MQQVRPQNLLLQQWRLESKLRLRLLRLRLLRLRLLLLLRLLRLGYHRGCGSCGAAPHNIVYSLITLYTPS